MIFLAEDQLVLDVQLHLQVHKAADATGREWLWFLLNIHTLFSVLVIVVIAKLDLLRFWSIKSAEIRIQVGTKQGSINGFLRANPAKLKENFAGRNRGWERRWTRLKLEKRRETALKILSVHNINVWIKWLAYGVLLGADLWKISFSVPMIPKRLYIKENINNNTLT